MNTLKAEKRSKDIKAKRLRREGFVTGNVFGKKIEGSIPVKMAATDVERLMKTDNKGSQIMLDVDGESYDVLIKEVSYNSMASRFDEIDFQALVSDEKVHSVAEVVLLGHDKVTEGVIEEKLNEISYRALPAALVDKVKIDLSQMRIGDVIRVKDLDIYKNPDVDVLSNPEAVVVEINAVHMKAEDIAAEEEEAAAADAEKK